MVRTVILSKAKHFPIEALTVYVVCCVGATNGSLSVESSIGLPAGLLVHEKYKPSVIGCNCVVSVRQIVCGGPASSVTKSTTRTRTESVLIQPFSFNVATYIVVDFGYTDGLGVPASNRCG